MPNVYLVEEVFEDGDRCSYVRGLPGERYLQGADGKYSDVSVPDTLLMHINGWGEPSFRLDTRVMMLEVLYDLFQTHDSLQEGDLFKTKFGDFLCRDVHVIPADGSLL